MTKKSALIAASVAGLFAAATPLVASAEKTGDDVQCEGINACKGKGWVKTTSADCKAKGGKVAPAAK